MPSLSQPTLSSANPDEVEAALARLMEELRAADVPDAIRQLAEQLQSALDQRTRTDQPKAERETG